MNNKQQAPPLTGLTVVFNSKLSTPISSIGQNDTTRKDIFIIDTGGGKCSRITQRTWKVVSNTNHKTDLLGYQEKGPPQCYQL